MISPGNYKTAERELLSFEQGVTDTPDGDSIGKQGQILCA
jgi:hypothetical protein